MLEYVISIASFVAPMLVSMYLQWIGTKFQLCGGLFAVISSQWVRLRSWEYTSCSFNFILMPLPKRHQLYLHYSIQHTFLAVSSCFYS